MDVISLNLGKKMKNIRPDKYVPTPRYCKAIFPEYIPDNKNIEPSTANRAIFLFINGIDISEHVLIFVFHFDFNIPDQFDT
jgi:hypothetical protein